MTGSGTSGGSPAENLNALRQRVSCAIARSGRSEGEVRILLATKTVCAETLRNVARSGARLFGENKVRELLDKSEALADLAPEWNFIGHLQRNKINKVIPRITMLHSLDRLSLAESIERHMERENRSLDVLIQVNTSSETSKFGVHPDQLESLVRAVAALPRLRIRGLMTLALFSRDESVVRPCFERLRELRERIAGLGIERVEMRELSMGMSHDFEWAVEEGATIIRIGTAVFGRRCLPDSYYWPDQSP